MQVFLDAWLERTDPVVYVRACDSGQALFCLKGDEITALMTKRNLCSDDLVKGKATSYRLKEVVS